MADHYNHYEPKQFARTVADAMDFPLPEQYAPGITWASQLLKERMGGKIGGAHGSMLIEDMNVLHFFGTIK